MTKLQNTNQIVYTRTQQGHSVLKLILTDWVTLYMRTAYYAISKNHYFYA